MAKSFNVSFNINGAMDGSLQAALKAAANAMRGLGNAAKSASAAASASRSGLAGMANSLNQLQAAAQRYKQVQDTLRQTMSDMSKAGQNLRSAKAKYDAETSAVEKLKQKLAELKSEQDKIGTSKSSGSSTLKQLRQDLANLKKSYAEAKKAGDTLKMSQLGAQIKSTQGAIQSQQASVRAAAQAYKELSEKVKQAKADLQAAQTAQSSSARGLSSAQSDASRLAASYKSQQAALNALRASLSSAGFNVSNFSASESRLASDIDRVNSALRQQQALTNAQSQSARSSQEMFNAYNNFQGALSTAGAIASPFTAAVENAMTFEHAMSRVKALTQTSNIMAGDTATVQREMALLEGQARELGATTQFTMTQAADAMGYLGMAGWKTEQIYGTMPGMLNLAAGAGTDLARTADIVSDNMTAMQVPVEKAQHFMDVYAYALTNSNVNLESLGETMKYAAPVAAAFGASLEDTAAMTMMMGNAGIKGSMAGTALRMGLLRLSGPPKKASKAMNELGISVSDATAMALESEAELARLGIQYDKNAPPMEKMGNIINQLSTKMQGLSREEKLASIGAIFGANAASGWVNIIEQGPEVFNKYLNALKNCDGYSEQFAHTMNDDTRGAMIALESAMDAVVNSVGTALLPAVRSAAEAFAPIATAAAQFIQAHPGIIQAAAAIAAALASIVVGAAAVKLAFAGWNFITSSILLVRTALASLGSGAMLGGLISRLAAVRVALMSTFAAGGLATTGGWTAMFAAISTKATAAAAAIRTFFASLTLGSAASGIAATLSSIGTAIAGAARAAMAFAFSPIGVALMALALAGMYVYQNWEKVSGVFSNIAGIITGALGNAFATVQPAIQSVMTAFESLGSSGAIQGLVSTLGGALVASLASVATIIASALATVINVVAQVAAAVTGIISGIVATVSGILSGDWSAAWEGAKSAAEAALNGIKGIAESIFNGITTAIDGIGTAWNAIFGDSPKVPETPTAQAPTAQPAAVAPAAQVAAPEVAPIDTSATQAALDQVGSSASNAASQMQGMEQATAGVDQMSAQFAAAGAGVQQMATSATQAGAGVQTFSTNAQQAGAAAQTFGTSAQNAATGTDALGTSAAGATSGIEALSSSAAGATGGVSALGSAASGAAGSVSGLGAAVQSACAALASAGASAAAAVSSAAPKANYKGGIYPKGQFLTTFAEKSPEAAIPIDNSKRARELWTQTGQMLGMLPGSGGGYDSAQKDAFGNVVGMDIPEYNRIGEGDTEDVKIDKRRVQREQYEAEQAAKSIVRQTVIAAAEQVQSAAESSQTQAAPTNIPTSGYDSAAKDELGNLIGVNIPEYNRVTGNETIAVRRDKIRAQREQFEAQLQATNAAQQKAMAQATAAAEQVQATAEVSQAQAESASKLAIAAATEYNSAPQNNAQLQKVHEQIKKNPRFERRQPTATSERLSRTMQSLSTAENRRSRSSDRGVFNQQKSSGFPLGELVQMIPGFKGNIGGFDILGGLSGGNIFGSFGSLDGLGGGFPKQGKNPFPSTPISFGGILNKLGSIGNFGALGDLGGGLGKIGGLDDLPVLNSKSAGGSAPTEFHVTINVTVNGNADENAVRRGVEQAIPSLDDWARNFAAFKHDEARRSFV